MPSLPLRLPSQVQRLINIHMIGELTQGDCSMYVPRRHVPTLSLFTSPPPFPLPLPRLTLPGPATIFFSQVRRMGLRHDGRKDAAAARPRLGRRRPL